jgi:hypothetical protein
VPERVVQRISEQGFGSEYLSLAPAPPQTLVGGRWVLRIPARVGGPEAERSRRTTSGSWLSCARRPGR